MGETIVVALITRLLFLYFPSLELCHTIRARMDGLVCFTPPPQIGYHPPLWEDGWNIAQYAVGT